MYALHRFSIVRGAKVVMHNNRKPVHTYTYASISRSKSQKCVSKFQGLIKERVTPVKDYIIVLSIRLFFMFFFAGILH